MLEKLYSISEVAILLGKTYDQVWYMVITGKMKGHKVGWSWVILESDIPKTKKIGGV